MTEAFTQKRSVHRPPHAPATAADVMRPAPATIGPRDHVAAAAYLMKHAGVTALVVVDDDQAKQPVGIITEADIVQAVADGKDLNDVRIRALITTPDRRQRGDKHPGRGQIHADRAFPAPAGGRRSRPDRDGRHHRCLRRLARPAAG
jgi:CBS domain-containing protein